jgi:hypothetical protein
MTISPTHHSYVGTLKVAGETVETMHKMKQSVPCVTVSRPEGLLRLVVASVVPDELASTVIPSTVGLVLIVSHERFDTMTWDRNGCWWTHDIHGMSHQPDSIKILVNGTDWKNGFRKLRWEYWLGIPDACGYALQARAGTEIQLQRSGKKGCKVIMRP